MILHCNGRNIYKPTPGTGVVHLRHFPSLILSFLTENPTRSINSSLHTGNNRYCSLPP